ncbi:pyridoxal-phosphate dependent enzyme [Segniliparus rotundus]
MKVVSALTAVKSLLDSKTIIPGDTVIDSSSGIYAHALALACHRYGLQCHIVGSTTIDATLRAQLAVLGVRLEQMPSSSNLKLDQNRRVARIREILGQHPEYHWMRQYHDRVHYLGYRAVAAMIAHELGVRELTLVGPVGTGASSGGLTTALRENGVDTTLVGVQPFGSVTFGAEHVEDPEVIIAGIGSSIHFDNVAPNLFDVVHWISFTAALSGAISLLREHAVFAGLSSGAAYLAALWEHRRDPARATLFVAPDTGHRYVDSVFTRYQLADPVEQLEPFAVEDRADLAMPWSRMHWGRRGGAGEAIADLWKKKPLTATA